MSTNTEYPKLPGYYYCPSNTERLIKLTFGERRELLHKQGNYTLNPRDKLTVSEKIDMECALDNDRIPTHRRMGTQLPSDIAYGHVPLFTLLPITNSTDTGF